VFITHEPFIDNYDTSYYLSLLYVEQQVDKFKLRWEWYAVTGARIKFDNVLRRGKCSLLFQHLYTEEVKDRKEMGIGCALADWPHIPSTQIKLSSRTFL